MELQKNQLLRSQPAFAPPTRRLPAQPQVLPNCTVQNIQHSVLIEGLRLGELSVRSLAATPSPSAKQRSRRYLALRDPSCADLTRWFAAYQNNRQAMGCSVLASSIRAYLLQTRGLADQQAPDPRRTTGRSPGAHGAPPSATFYVCSRCITLPGSRCERKGLRGAGKERGGLRVHHSGCVGRGRSVVPPLYTKIALLRLFFSSSTTAQCALQIHICDNVDAKSQLS